jgi:hypothetical protein
MKKQLLLLFASAAVVMGGSAITHTPEEMLPEHW